MKKFKADKCYLEIEGKNKVSEKNIMKVINLFKILNKEQNITQKPTQPLTQTKPEAS